jgi:DNA transformation protein
MAVSEGYLEYVMERLEKLGTVTARKMFGGVGLYFEGTFFALIDDDILYFKVDNHNESEFRKAGMEPFHPFGLDSYAMRYFSVPDYVLEDEGELHKWAAGAVTAASKTRRKRISRKSRARANSRRKER